MDPHSERGLRLARIYRPYITFFFLVVAMLAFTAASMTERLFYFDDGAHDMEKPDEHTVPEDPDGEKS